jgi:GT2 family glycosyltransferase
MHLSIITVNTNGKDKVLDQIESVFAGLDGLEVEEIISDNGSTDGSVEEIRRRFPQVKVIENGKNLGFGAANNRALPLVTSDLVLFLNPDMRVLPGTLKKIVEWMRVHEDVGIVSPKLTDEAGNFVLDAKPRRLPGVLDQVAILLKLPHLFPSVLNRYMYEGFDPELQQEVDSVRGSFMLTRKSILDRLGWGFDPRYFIWFEDVDTCREVAKMGYKVMYSPVISCVDYVGTTFKKQPTLMKQKWFTKSMLVYFQKWEPWYKWMWIALFRPVGLGLAWSKEKITKK